MPAVFRIVLGTLLLVATVLGPLPVAQAPAAEPAIRLAANPHDKTAPQAGADEDDKDELTPEQKFEKRFPQPVRVGDLIGLPVLDFGDSTIGFVRDVVRNADGKISLIVPYSGRFGWLPVAWGKRPVAVPIETVAILARQLNALEFGREDFDEAPTWRPADGMQVPRDEKTRIALSRR